MKYFLSLFSTVALLCLSACQKENIALPKDEAVPLGSRSVLGKKLNIPFTVTTMQKAYENLTQNPTTAKTSPFYAKGANFRIEASHYYYRFLPKDSLQYQNLVKDSLLMVSDVPLDYEVAHTGDYYKDPELHHSDFTYYYAVVPAEHPIPEDLQYRRLAELYFPPEEDTAAKATTSEALKAMSSTFYEALETEALKISQNLEDEELQQLRFLDPEREHHSMSYAEAQQRNYSIDELQVDYRQEAMFRRRSWIPQGRITVEEDVLNQDVGVMGAEVRVRKWGLLVIRKAITDREGSFSTRSIRTKRVKYSVYFKNVATGFTVKAGTVFWDARYRDKRKHKRAGWFPHFATGSSSHFYALVHNAAFDYYDRVMPQYGLHRPRRGIDISAKFSLDASSQTRPHLPLVSDIRITRMRNGVYRGSDGIYATTVHELTHAGHRKMDTFMFDFLTHGNTERLLMRESWAEGVETIVTNDRYLQLDPGYSSSHPRDGGGRWNYRRQTDRVIDMDEYTPIVEDLIDNLNQNTIPGVFGIQPVDRVSGYSLHQIQSALNGSRNIDEWENRLRWHFDNPTEGNLTELFDYIREVKENID